jgi:ATP-dependent DNA helicase RecG
VLGGIKEKTAEKLQRLGIATIEDLLLHFPFRHEDFSRVTPIGFVKPGAKTTIRARVYRVRAGLTRFRRMRLTEAELSDGAGSLVQPAVGDQGAGGNDRDLRGRHGRARRGRVGHEESTL